MESKIDILNYDDKKLRKWINKTLKMCGKNIEYNDDLLPYFRQSIKKYYKPKIELSFRQIFPYNFGLNIHGFPDINFKKYYNDHILVKKTINFLSSSVYFNEYSIISDECSSINYIVCYDPDNNILYDNGCPVEENISYIDIYKKANKKSIEKLLKCVKSNRSVHIRLGYTTKRKNENTYSLYHVITIFLNFKNNKYYLLDSSIRSSNEIRFERNAAIAKLFSKYLNDKLHKSKVFLKINIKPFTKMTHKCDWSLQGSSGTCSVWTNYMILSHLQNPEMKYLDIYKELLKYTQEERDNLLLRFMYFIYSKYKKIIDTWVYDESTDIPKYTL